MGAFEGPQLLTRHRYTVADYYRLSEAGVLGPEDRVELIDGQVVDMAPTGTRHAGCVKALITLLTEQIGRRAQVSVQDPLRVNDYNEPEPDVMVLHARADYYSAAHPVATDVLLLIEVSDSTARYDREIKVPLYASAGVPEVWVFDLDARLLRCYREPRGGEYTQTQVLAQPGLMPLPGLPGLSIDVGGLLPSA